MEELEREKEAAAALDPGPTPGEWVSVLMDFTIGTGIVLWHMMVASAMAFPEGDRRQEDPSRASE